MLQSKLVIQTFSIEFHLSLSGLHPMNSSVSSSLSLSSFLYLTHSLCSSHTHTHRSYSNRTNTSPLSLVRRFDHWWSKPSIIGSRYQNLHSISSNESLVNFIQLVYCLLPPFYLTHISSWSCSRLSWYMVRFSLVWMMSRMVQISGVVYPVSFFLSPFTFTRIITLIVLCFIQWLIRSMAYLRPSTLQSKSVIDGFLSWLLDLGWWWKSMN